MLNYDGLKIALCILIMMLLTCHIMNYLYPKYPHQNNFLNISTLPTQYNQISYYPEHNKIPCDNQAQIPCNIKKKCTKQQNLLSDSEIAILYKEAYEMAGQEILNRYLQETKPTTTS